MDKVQIEQQSKIHPDQHFLGYQDEETLLAQSIRQAEYEMREFLLRQKLRLAWRQNLARH
jgi:hypothetical protein